MAAPQITGFHSLSFTQFDPLLPAPPTATAVPVSQSQSGPPEQDPYRDRSEPFPRDHQSITQSGDLDQPLDLSFSRDAQPESKRSADGNCEDRCVKRARFDNWNGVSETANHFAPPVFNNGHGSGVTAVHAHRYNTQDYPSLPHYSASGHGGPVQNDMQSGSLLTPLRPFPPSSSVHDSGLPPYYHPVQDKRIRSPYGCEPAVSSSSMLVTSSEMRHPDPSRSISLGLPLPHNSVFTRSVSPLFQQSWHHSPVSVASHAHSSLLHAPSSVSPRLQQNVFQSPMSGSSDVQQRSLHYDSPRLLPLHGQNDSLQNLSSASSHLQQNMFPPPQPSLLPNPQENSVLPSAQQDLVPTPQQTLISTLQQNNLQPPQQNALPSPQHQSLISSPQQNNTLPSQQPNAFPHPPAPNQSLTRSNNTSPRPFYRPFEDTTSSQVSFTATTTYSQAEKVAKENSQEDVAASSSSLSLPTSTTTPRSASNDQTSQRSPRTENCIEQRPVSEEERVERVTVPTQSDAWNRQDKDVTRFSDHSPDPGLSRPSSQNGNVSPAPSHAPIADTAKPTSSSLSSSTPERMEEGESATAASQRVKARVTSGPKKGNGPIQDNAVRSSSSVSSEPALSKPSKGRGRKLESRLMKVVGTTPLARIREERARQQAKAREERMKMLMSRRQQYLGHGRGDHPPSDNGDEVKGKKRAKDRDNSDKGHKQSDDSNNNEGSHDSSTDGSKGKAHQGVSDGHTSDGGSHPASSEQPSPSSSTADSDNNNDVSDGAPIPPDPNLKMSALDYLISKVLVERIDVPFKPENTEIKAIYTGAKQGRLTLVDLIELQVEASLKA